ncbi:MAG: hypothetical protein HW421_460 [Ignavibacteria bacterium]|nr:hypothetical protein [Ignavibacteria bacterium]
MNELAKDFDTKILRELVERFGNNIEAYHSSRYDEQNTRNDFINKFFKFLGWDIYNDLGLPEDFRDVILEDKVYIEGHSKAPDYAFKYGKQRYFFVEAKKPSVNIKEGGEQAFQLRRYAHTAGLALSILTNFSEFAVYDTRIKPQLSDKPGTARIFYCTFDEYEKNWEFIASLFSKKAVMNDSLKKFSVENKALKGTQPLDKGILEMIEKWRSLLAENIALKNDIDKISNLNEAVQKIIDRIIFLRIAEDRNTEISYYLKTLSENKDIYSILIKYFHSSNKKYNSGLFAEVAWIDELAIDDKVLKGIILDLYYPNPYEFAVLPIEILGQIYEQFLGKTITFKRKTKFGHSIEVEVKPEVRKAGGVYYTPQYIVDYIVQNTIGKKIEKKAPNQIENLTILDPACGSGSFLVGTFKYLLSFHLDYYTNKSRIIKAQKEGRIYLAKEKTYRLSIREKRKILLNNIYGVDIDPQAVEVTKLSLLLTLMEGEIVEAKSELFFKKSNEALLPDLKNNIKCGNSLIGTDFYKNKEMEFFPEEEMEKINCFDWEEEFPEIFKGKKEKYDKEYFSKHLKKGVESAKKAVEYSKDAYQYTNTAYEYAKKFDLVKESEVMYNANYGGFDVVIGNPPYLNLTKNSIDENILEYYNYKFQSIHGGSSKNLFQLFIEKILQFKPKAFSFIVPEALLTTSSNQLIRNLMLINNSLISLAIFDHFVFVDATIGTTVFVLNDKISTKNVTVHKFTSINSKKTISEIKELSKEDLINNWDVSSENKDYDLLNKISEKKVLMKSIVNMFKGMVVENRKEHLRNEKAKDELPFLLGNSIIDKYYYEYKYFTNYNKLKIIGGTSALYKHQHIPRILIRRTGNKLCAVLSNQIELIESTLYILISSKIDLKYLIGILNSKLLSFYLNKKLITNKQGFPQILMWQLDKLPIRTIDFSNKTEKAQHTRMVSLVEQMLEAQKTAHSDKNIAENDKKIINQRIKILDKQIDTLVYELYGLTEEEIKIVEGE